MAVTATSTLVGAGLATVAAACFAVQYLGIRIGTDDGAVLDAVLVTLLCNVAITAPLVAVLYDGTLHELYTPTAVAAFAAAGIVGIWLARVCMFTGVENIGASRTSPVVASNALFATVFAYGFLGERVALAHLVGIVLVVGGVAILSWEAAAAGDDARSLRAAGADLGYPVAAAVLIGIEPVFITVGLAEGTPVLAGLAVMMLAGTVGFVGARVASGTSLRIRPDDPALQWYLVAGVAATGGFVAYFLALEAASVVVVMPILQTNTLLVIVLSALFLPARLERVTWRLVGAACVIVLGATIVSVVG
jgi:drug/metabolite transporter (DMT)-like permease